MHNPFAHYKAGVSPSMNQVRFAALPGTEWPAAWQGKTAYTLLSAESWRERARAAAAALGIPPDDPDPLPRLDGCLTAESPRVCAAALALAEGFGLALALLLITLQQGAAANRAARRDWDDSHWQWWASRRRVMVGGGLVAGVWGETAVAYASQLTHAYTGLTVHRAAHPALLPLIGVGRLAPPDVSTMAVFDFGQTAVKQATAHYRQQTLVGLSQGTSVPARCGDLYNLATDEASLTALADFMTAELARGWQIAGAHTPAVAASVACYLYDGRPIPGYLTCYGRLQRLRPNIQMLLQDRLQARLGEPVRLYLVHDGAAAALAFAGEVETAVLTFGTAIGVGFPPDESYLPLAQPLDITS